MLVDSQVVVWILTGPDRLGPEALRLLKTATRVHVSAASVWELTIKSMLGRLRIPDDLTTRLESEGLSLLDVTARHSEGIRAFPELIRHDPFDRLLVAQAHTERLPLLTSDRVLLGLDRDWIVDATT